MIRIAFTLVVFLIGTSSALGDAPPWCEIGSEEQFCEHIVRVTVGDIDNESAHSPGGYADYTLELATEMAQGRQYQITVVGAEIFPGDCVGAWVDWNQDYMFDDSPGSAEKVFFDVSSGPGPYTGTVVVPQDAPLGTPWLRVRLAFETVAPCGVTRYGETEDYTIVVVPGTCCTGPSRGNVDGSPDNLVTMSDLTEMISHLFILMHPARCNDEGNVDLSVDGMVTMSDLTVLIDHLFISLDPLPPCP